MFYYKKVFKRGAWSASKGGPWSVKGGLRVGQGGPLSPRGASKKNCAPLSPTLEIGLIRALTHRIQLFVLKKLLFESMNEKQLNYQI